MVVVNATIELVPLGGAPQLTMSQLREAPPGVHDAVPPLTVHVRLATPVPGVYPVLQE